MPHVFTPALRPRHVMCASSGSMSLCLRVPSPSTTRCSALTKRRSAHTGEILPDSEQRDATRGSKPTTTTTTAPSAATREVERDKTPLGGGGSVRRKPPVRGTLGRYIGEHSDTEEAEAVRTQRMANAKREAEYQAHVAGLEAHPSDAIDVRLVCSARCGPRWQPA